MKLIDLTCPRCGASIKADPGKDTCTCEYCECILYIDKESKSAEEKQSYKKPEQGQKTERDKIAEEREKLFKYLYEARPAIKKEEQIYSEYASKKQQCDMIFKASKIVTIGGGSLIGCILFFPLVSILGGIIHPVILLAASCVLCSVYFVRRNKKKMETKAILQQQCEILLNDYKETAKETERLLDAIPVDYRYSVALDSIHRLIRDNTKVNTLEEVIVLYEKENIMLKTSNPVEVKNREKLRQAYLDREKLIRPE